MLKKTALYETHKKLGARLVEFGGWEMPVQYSGVIDEHQTVRTAVGLFDISHMGEILVEGERAEEFVNYVTTNDLTKIKVGGCQYAGLLNQEGTFVDDVISYKYSSSKILIVVNASNTDKDYEWLKKMNGPRPLAPSHEGRGEGSFNVKITNVSASYFQLALQGPLAEKTLAPLVDFDLKKIAYYHFADVTMLGTQVILSRTGYTGEDGFEIYGPVHEVQKFWDELLKAGAPYGIKPIGLAARDTLRLEASYSLYGHEISDTINPLEARLAWIVKLDKPNFIGKEALQVLKQKGIERELLGIEMIDAGIPRQGFEIAKNQTVIGVVTSGTHSPTLKKPVAMILVKKGILSIGSECEVLIRGQSKKAKVISLPFYKRS